MQIHRRNSEGESVPLGISPPTNLWADDRYKSAGSDITRDAYLARQRVIELAGNALEDDDGPLIMRGKSCSIGDFESMRGEDQDELLSSSDIAQPGGFRRMHLAKDMSPEDAQLMLDSVQPFMDKLTTDKTVFITELKQLERYTEDNANRFRKQSIAVPDALPHAQQPTPLKNNKIDKDLSKKDAIIGIGGGVGPAAGVALHSKIIENSITDGTDQTHFEVYHLSRSHDLPDRTRFLLGHSKENPALGLARTMVALHAAAAAFGQDAVAGVPCNTFHAPPIWKVFLEEVDKLCQGKVKVVHMLEETMELIKVAVPHAKRIGVLSTTGTRSSQVYAQLLKEQGFDLVQVPENMQAEVHEAIYNKEWGVKATFPVHPKAIQRFKTFATLLAKAGAEAIILGCTEIPLALPMPFWQGVPLVDPVLALARALIRESNSDKLKALEEKEPSSASNYTSDDSEAVEDDSWESMSVMSNETYNSEDSLDDYNEQELESGWQNHGGADELLVHEQLRSQQLEISNLKEQMAKLLPGQAKKQSATIERSDSLDLSQFTHMERLVPKESQIAQQSKKPVGDPQTTGVAQSSNQVEATGASHDPVVRALLVLLLAIVIGFIGHQTLVN